MIEAKIKLSKDELLLVQNGNIILTKNAIMQKVISLFSTLSENMQAEHTKSKLPEAIMATTPKISKGENYKGLPYVILDYPRLFTNDHIFAIRTLFWWGNYFSITLHLKGIYKNLFSDSIKENILLLTKKDFSICISSDQWQHELEEDNYISLSRVTENTLNEIIANKHFLKLSAKVELNEWENGSTILMELYRDILQSVKRG